MCVCVCVCVCVVCVCVCVCVRVCVCVCVCGVCVRVCVCTGVITMMYIACVYGNTYFSPGFIGAELAFTFRINVQQSLSIPCQLHRRTRKADKDGPDNGAMDNKRMLVKRLLTFEKQKL